jgi:hypothetical protein
MPQNPIITFPTPPYQNVPIHAEYYKPQVFVISAITMGVTTTITTTLPHDYEIGQQIRLLIPNKYGSRGLNEQIGYVLSIPTTTSVQTDINSIGIDPFIAAPTFVGFESKIPPQIVAIGDINSGFINNTMGRFRVGKHIPGSFINISPL